MLERWRGGAQVVWAVRRQRPGGRGARRVRRALLLDHAPRGRHEGDAGRGADFFLVDRVGARRLPAVSANATSACLRADHLARLPAGYRVRQAAPRGGRSGWTLARKIKLVIDSVRRSRRADPRLRALGGALSRPALVLPGRAGAAARLGAGRAAGARRCWSASPALQLLALGIVGEYVWRALDEARRRPPYVMEARTPSG